VPSSFSIPDLSGVNSKSYSSCNAIAGGANACNRGCKQDLLIDEDKIADEIYVYSKVFINKALVINKAQNCSSF